MGVATAYKTSIQFALEETYSTRQPHPKGQNELSRAATNRGTAEVIVDWKELLTEIYPRTSRYCFGAG